MSKPLTPFNLKVMEITPERIRRLQKIEVLDTFDGNTQNFHDDGLYSIRIFGHAGTKQRDHQFAYIDVKTELMHPFLLRSVIRLKSLYEDIITGKQYALWDATEKDFVKSDALSGETGYAFFLKHWKNIQFKRTGSALRDNKITLINKYKETGTYRQVVVVPAGIRDITVDETGRVKQTEVNGMYTKLISLANSIPDNPSLHTAIIDNTRVSLQNAFNDVYTYFEGIIEGKRGFIQAKWGGRSVFYGTRNVITSMDTSTTYLGSEYGPKYTDTTVGLNQVLYAVMPYARHYLLTGFISTVFTGISNQIYLINPKTLAKELVKVSHEVQDRWTTTAGIDSIIKMYSNTEMRNRPIMIEGRYLGLVYRTNRYFKFFDNIDDFPTSASFSRKDVHPITWAELIYVSGYQHWNTFPAYVTRYPVSGFGSIYPTMTYAKTTVRGLILAELGHDWQPKGEGYVAYEYPDIDVGIYMDSMSVHPSRLAGMLGDHDGDTTSFNAVMIRESQEETKKLLTQRTSYVNGSGGFYADAITDPVKRVIINMNGD